MAETASVHVMAGSRRRKAGSGRICIHFWIQQFVTCCKLLKAHLTYHIYMDIHDSYIHINLSSKVLDAAVRDLLQIAQGASHLCGFHPDFEADFSLTLAPHDRHVQSSSRGGGPPPSLLPPPPEWPPGPPLPPYPPPVPHAHATLSSATHTPKEPLLL